MQGARSESGLLYSFKKRKILYTVATFISYSFMLFVLYFPTFYSNNLLSIPLYFLWFLLLYIFLLNICFKKIEIYSDKVIIYRYILKDNVIKISNIHSTNSSDFGISWLTGEVLIIKEKTKYYINFFYAIPSLTYKQTWEAENLIKNLIKD